ncbi:MAG: hypothetical protein R3D71_07295 [Rickettsiales bacterium]
MRLGFFSAIFISFLFIISGSVLAKPTRLVLNNYLYSCPPPTNVGLTADSGSGAFSEDYLFVHVVDSKGNDFEAWCEVGLAMSNYQFYISKGNKKEMIDICELFRGINDVSLTIDGTTSVVTSPSGAKVINVNGDILTYYHHNFNSSKDFHTIYKYKTKQKTRVNTVRVKEPGKPRKSKVVDAEKSTFSISFDKGDRQEQAQEIVHAPLPEGEENFSCADSEPAVAYNAEVEMWEVPVNYSENPVEVLYPTHINIADISSVKNKEIVFDVSSQEDRDFFSVAIDSIYKKPSVVIDGKAVSSFKFNNSKTHTTINIDIDNKPHKIIVKDLEV